MNTNNKELLDILNFHFVCCSWMTKDFTGSAHDGIYFEAEHISDPFFTFEFEPNELTQEVISIYSDRMSKIGRPPSFLRISTEEDINIANKLNLELRDSTLWIKADLNNRTKTKSCSAKDIEIEIQKLPYSEEFIKTFLECYTSNEDDIGYEYNDDFGDGFRNARPVDTIDESTFILRYKGKTAGIATIDNDIKNKVSFLYNVGTTREFRRLGLSRFLIELVIEHAINDGINFMYLYTEEDSPMQTYYEDLGFKIVGTTQLFVQPKK